MKKLLLRCTPLLFYVQPATAQPGCPIPQSAANLTVNNIKARINNGGDMFNDAIDGVFAYQPVASHPSTIYDAALWMGGFDAAGNLKLAAMSYRQNRTEFSAGPLDPITGNTDVQTCANWDIVFTASRERIDAFQANLANWAANPQAAIAQYPDIMGWPGLNNSFFNDVYNFQLPENQILAPFVDTDNDGNYNPISGDYPAVKLQGKMPFVPGQMTWCVYNDVGATHQLSGGAPIGMEIQLTAWAFETNTGAPFSNSIFTSHKLIYRGVDLLSDFYIGIWTDFDLGCFADDYIGCDTTSRTFYAYNQDAVDGQPGNTCIGYPTFGEETPVQSATFLNKPLDKLIYYNNASVGNPLPVTTDPNTAIEYYQYLNGHWRDGSPLVKGGSGANPGSSDSTSYAFPDDPADPSGWSMCSANLPFVDQRVIASSKIGDLQPGAVNELTTAWILHPNIPAPCNIGNMLTNVSTVQNAFNNGFQSVSSTAVPHAALLITASPNPASGAVTLHFPTLVANSITCCDAQGRIFYHRQDQVEGVQQINVNTWPKGVYIAHLVTDRGMVAVRFVVN